MNILITGSCGQLGSELRSQASLNNNHTYFFTDIAEKDEADRLDITNEKDVVEFVSNNNIEMIINCAAYTNVDKAEENEDLATLLNATAVGNLAIAAKQNSAKIIHISTDYLFDGNANTPYTETDEVHPNTVYGQTKCLGESYLANHHIIIRTAWLYSAIYGNNFMKTMIRLGSEKDELKVVYDQVGSPTNAKDLAEAIFTIIDSGKWVPGIYHFTNEGVTSWYDFATRIIKYAEVNVLPVYINGKLYPGHKCEVLPIRSSEYQYKTPRPNYSVLDKSKIKNTYGIKIRHWDDALLEAVNIHMTYEQDKEGFKNTPYEGMNFEYLETWDNYDSNYVASPRFLMENGDILVFDKNGNIQKLDYKESVSDHYSYAMDNELFVGTEYEGQTFKRLGSWQNFDKYNYSSPQFLMENGDTVVFDKYGKVQKINDNDVCR